MGHPPTHTRTRTRTRTCTHTCKVPGALWTFSIAASFSRASSPARASLRCIFQCVFGGVRQPVARPLWQTTAYGMRVSCPQTSHSLGDGLITGCDNSFRPTAGATPDRLWHRLPSAAAAEGDPTKNLPSHAQARTIPQDPPHPSHHPQLLPDRFDKQDAEARRGERIRKQRKDCGRPALNPSRIPHRPILPYRTHARG